MSSIRSWQRLWLVALAVALCCASSAQAAKQLKWKFKKGETLNYAMAQKAAILIDANGIEIDVKFQQVFDLTWEVKDVAADGTGDLVQKIDRVQLKMNTPFTGEFVYDSKDTENEPAGEIWERMGGPIKALVGGEFTMKISPTGEVSDIKLPEKLVEVLNDQKGGGGQAAMLMGGNMFSEQAIKQTFEQAVLVLPAEGVADGKSWNKKLENKMGPLGTQKIDVAFSYAGAEEKDGKALEKIATKTEITFEPSDNNDLDVEMELTKQEGSGTILFDANAGHTIESTNVQKLTMEGDFMGNEFAQDITMTLLLKKGTSDGLKLEDEAAESEGDAAGDDADKKSDN